MSTTTFDNLVSEQGLDLAGDHSASKSATAEAVEKALNAVEPGFSSRAVKNEGAKVPAPPSGKRIAPVTRSNGDSYRPRLLAGNRTDVEVIREARKHGVAILLEGFPGCGKTALVEAAFGDELITLAGHGESEVGDLVGGYTQKPDGSYLWNDGPLVRAMKEGRPLFVDDCTLIPPGVLARLYPAMDGRGQIIVTEHEGETVTAEEGFYVVGAHNPGAYGALLSEALSSRFGMQFAVTTDFQLAEKLGVSRKAVTIAAALHTRRADTGSWAPEMRELLTFQRICDTLGVEIAASNLISCAPEADRSEVAIEVSARWPEVSGALAVKSSETVAS